MKRILLAWELGEGFGHIAKTMPVAQAFASQGHHVTLALQDMKLAHILNQKGFTCVEAPRSAPSDKWRRPFNYSALLLNNGFDSPEKLGAAIAEWRKLFATVRPDLLLCDHAPSAMLASHVAGIPAAFLGGGFFCPPPGKPYPNMIYWERRSDAALSDADDALTKSINKTLASIPGASPLNSAHDLFDSLPRFLCTFQELDHYRRNQGQHYGALFENVSDASPAWPGRYRKKIFIYLTGHPAFVGKLLRALANVQADVLAVLRGIPEAAIPWDLPSHLAIRHSPVNGAQALAACDLVINHSSLGLLSACLLAGKPMALAPVFLEQSILCKRGIETGACLAIAGDDSEKRLAQRIAEMLEETRYQDAAAQFAAKYAGYRAADTANKIVSEAIALIN